MSWKPPLADTIFGEFLGYSIKYHARDTDPKHANEVLLRDSNVEVSL